MLMSRIDVERVDDECEMVLDSIQHFFQLVSFALSELPRESNRNQLHDRVVLALRQLISSIGQNLLSDQLLRHIKCLWEHFLNHQVVRNTCRFQSSFAFWMQPTSVTSFDYHSISRKKHQHLFIFTRVIFIKN